MSRRDGDLAGACRFGCVAEHRDKKTVFLPRAIRYAVRKARSGRRTVQATLFGMLDKNSCSRNQN